MASEERINSAQIQTNTHGSTKSSNEIGTGFQVKQSIFLEGSFPISLRRRNFIIYWRIDPDNKQINAFL